MTAVPAVIILLALSLRIWLNARQYAHLRRQMVPPAYWADSASMQRAIEGAMSRIELSSIALILEGVVCLWLALAGVTRLEDLGHGAGLTPVTLAVAVAAGILLIVGAIRRAAEAAIVFLVDARLGLGRPSAHTFLADTGRRLLVSGAKTIPLLLVIAVLMDVRGNWWWLGAWALWLLVTATDIALRPLAEMRFYHSTSELVDRPLASRIAALLAGCGLGLSHVRVIDASRRTKRANASVQGFGKMKTILLHDTLLARLGHDEVLAVVAHEAGHACKGHQAQYLSALALFGLLAAFAAGAVHENFGATTAVQLGMLVVVMPSVGFLIRPLLVRLLQRFEFEADAFAASHVGGPSMIRALRTLYAVNGAVPGSDPLHSMFHASHPDPCERLARLSAPVGNCQT